MTVKCISGKRSYPTHAVAEEALIELWNRNDYRAGNAPLDTYHCEDCGNYHLTSRGPMNERLARYLSTHESKINKEAARWLDRFRNKH
ncbi:MAG TPA: hypothetical protein VEB86_05450 [Chryseosolibacter sp.]|nr:hypothetical protein [Chryseosolibacter sp.]